MKIIIGLGNPGLKYRATRHNVGFMALDLLAKRHRLRFKKRSFSSRCAEGRICSAEVLMAKPMTYMNKSGVAAVSILKHFGAVPEDLLTVSDDIDLSLGRIRLKSAGSSGGHNGLRSVIKHIGPDFPRLKLGVSSGRIYDAADYVLAPFRRGERKALSSMLEIAADCIEKWLSEGPISSMNEYNQAAE